MDQTTKPVPSVRAALQVLVDKAVAVLQRHILPDGGLSDHDALSELYGIFDGPDYRVAQAALAAPFGLTVEQESKYTTCPDTGRILSRATGKPIPDDEPIMIFRAQDVHTREVTRRYADLVHDNSAVHTSHGNVCFERYQRMVDFAQKHPERMKKPD